MNTIKTIQDYKEFLSNNRDKLCKYAVRVEELSSEDEWLQEDEWDEIYKRDRWKAKIILNRNTTLA